MNNGTFCTSKINHIVEERVPKCKVQGKIKKGNSHFSTEQDRKIENKAEIKVVEDVLQ